MPEGKKAKRVGGTGGAGAASIFHVAAALVELAGDEVDLRVSQY